MESIRGYRVGTDSPKPAKELRVDNLLLKPVAAHALRNLRAKVRDAGSNCEDRAEEFSGRTLPSDGDAAKMCLGCPAKTECAIFLEVGRPAYGVWAGQVRGRALEEEEEDKWN